MAQLVGNLVVTVDLNMAVASLLVIRDLSRAEGEWDPSTLRTRLAGIHAAAGRILQSVAFDGPQISD